MRIGYIASDWSGTISDDAMAVYKANMEIFKQYAKPMLSFEEWKEMFTLPPINFIHNHGIYDEPEKIFALYEKFYDESKKQHPPKPVHDAKNTFQQLKQKGKKLVILSSHPKENLMEEIGLYGLAGLFDHIQGSCGDKCMGLIQICRHFSIKPNELLYLGDMVYDIMCAKKAGTRSAGVCGGYHSKERLANQEPDLLLDKLSDLTLKIR
jgi:phosphoglycolate phosphatase-like HAD superfamily hydrolase